MGVALDDRVPSFACSTFETVGVLGNRLGVAVRELGGEDVKHGKQ